MRLVGDGEAPAREDGGLPVGERVAQVEGPRLGQLIMASWSQYRRKNSFHYRVIISVSVLYTKRLI